MMLSGRKRAMSGGGTTSHCWSEEDVRLSRQAAGQAEAPHLQGGIEGLAAVSGNLASFWSSDELRGGFEAMWRRIAPDERRHLLLSVCPFMPSQRGSTCTREGDDVRGAAWMIPEMGLKELEEDPEALLQLMAHRATTHPADLEAEDIGRMMSQAERGRFRMPSRQPKSVYVRDTPGYSAKKMTFSWDRMDQGQQLKTMQMLAKFWMIDSDFYELVLGRKSNIDMVLGHVVDEYLTTYSRQTNAPLTLAPIWAPNAANMSIGQLEEYWERTIVASRASMSARAQERARYLEDDQDEQGQAAGEEEEAAEDEPETKEEEVDYPAEAPMEETGLSGSDHGTVGADGTVVRDAVVMMATALKEEGNTIYQANGPRCLELAMGRYQSAIDALHQLPHGSLKDDDGLKLMAMLKSNTANIFLKQANLAPLPAQKVDLANKALAACDYVLNHEVYQARMLVMPQKLKQKLSDRRDKALRLLEVVQEHEQRRQPRQQQGSQDPLTPELNEYLDTRIRRFLDERPSPSQTIRASKRGDGRKKTVNAQPQRIAKGAGTAAPPISKIVALDSEAAAGQCINETCPICCTTFSETRHKLVALLECCVGYSHACCVECLWTFWINSKHDIKSDTGPSFQIHFSCPLCRRLIDDSAMPSLGSSLVEMLPHEERDNLEDMSARLYGQQDAHDILEQLALCHGGKVHCMGLALQEAALWCASESELSSADKQKIYEEERMLQKRLMAKLGLLHEERTKAETPEEKDENEQRIRVTTGELEEVSRRAAAAIFERINSADGDGGISVNGVRALDFHALHVQDVAVMLDDLVMPVLPVLKKLVIITGHGRHNRRGQAPLQERLANELKYRRIPFERVHCNPGAFLLTSP